MHLASSSFLPRSGDVYFQAVFFYQTYCDHGQKPISFSLSGLNILLTKDIYKPGETIKISYTSEELKQFEIRLLQNSNLVCYCEAYGQNCSKVSELPPAIAGDVKTLLSLAESVRI